MEAHVAHLAICVGDGELCFLVSDGGTPGLPNGDGALACVARVADMSDCIDVGAVNFAW